MHHIAILDTSRKFLPKIISGEKTIESRWYAHKRDPWNKVTKGDIVYFKNSGEPVSAKALVSNVLQFENLTPKKVSTILKKYGRAIGIPFSSKVAGQLANKKYCILVFLSKPTPIAPFRIDKKGYGMMQAWLVCKDINQLKKK